jgi:hypothetical protein
MIFYSLITYFITPALGYHYFDKEKGITYGIVLGSVISMYLWINYGQKLALQ